ncbi:MAG: Rossmann-like domain-containing protein [Rivularia sp. (in: cyanobacteria)]
MSLNDLWCYIEQLNNSAYIEELPVRSLSATHLLLWPGPNERVYDIHRLSVTIERQGCSYTTHPIDITYLEPYLNTTWQNFRDQPDFIQIAVLDAVLPSLPMATKPFEIARCQKPLWTKSLWRADTLVKNIKRLIATLNCPTPRVALVGYSDVIFYALKKIQVAVDVFDLDPRVINKTLVDSTVIQHGEAFFAGEPTYDVLVVTGMTLANGTFWNLREFCCSFKTLIVMYAQTGGHLGSVMVELGVDLFVGECLPFYYEDGLSEINVYFSNNYHF